MGQHWILVGAGSAGCVLANRLSADPETQVTLLESGPSLRPGEVPAGIAGPSFMEAMAEPGRIYDDLLATRAAGIEPTVYHRGRGVGGSSAVNAMVALQGNPAMYASWGWHDADAAWANVEIPTSLAAPDELGDVDRALLHDDRTEKVDLTRRDGERVSAAQAYLWPVQDRPNLTVLADSPVQSVEFHGDAAVGVVLDDGSVIHADQVVVCAGAIHSPAVLLRSGVSVEGLGLGLQDHPSVVLVLMLQQHVEQAPRGLALASALHTTVGDDLIQLLPLNHLGPAPEAAGLAGLMVALMTPTGRAGSVAIDAAGEPVIDFALLSDARDVDQLLIGLDLAIEMLATPAFSTIVEEVYIDDIGTTIAALHDRERREQWVRSNCADYVHATSTCAMGTVVDQNFAVHGYQNLFVCDASVFPTIPDANTHLPTTMLAERFCLRHA